MQSGRKSQEWKIKMFFLLKFKIESCLFQSDATSLSVCKSFQALCLLLSYGRLCGKYICVWLGLCIFESLSDLYALVCNCLKVLRCLQIVLMMRRARKNTTYWLILPLIGRWFGNLSCDNANL